MPITAIIRSLYPWLVLQVKGTVISAGKGHRPIRSSRMRMTDEVVVACEGRHRSRRREILIKTRTAPDALHASQPAVLRAADSALERAILQHGGRSWTELRRVCSSSAITPRPAATRHRWRTPWRLRVMHLHHQRRDRLEFSDPSYAAALVKVPGVFLSGGGGFRYLLLRSAHQFPSSSPCRSAAASSLFRP